jgi:N-acetylglucosaminyldiphosphoundecaprenol N-acetyl-beta-D-mannosaminyltransferase
MIDSLVNAHEFAHIISLNPENMVEATENLAFRRAYDRAELVLADGVGITIAAKILHISCGERIAGVDLMRELIHTYPQKRIAFVGGLLNVAQKTLDYFMNETGTQGAHWKAFPDVDPSDPFLIEYIISEKPDLLFVAFGSPKQELWIEKHRNKLQGTVCIGVGQAFDVYGGMVKRAPRLMQALGLEWLYRLLTQPWRWRRQLRLLKFIYLVIGYRLFPRRSQVS